MKELGKNFYVITTLEENLEKEIKGEAKPEVIQKLKKELKQIRGDNYMKIIDELFDLKGKLGIPPEELKKIETKVEEVKKVKEKKKKYVYMQRQLTIDFINFLINYLRLRELSQTPKGYLV